MLLASRPIEVSTGSIRHILARINASPIRAPSSAFCLGVELYSFSSYLVHVRKRRQVTLLENIIAWSERAEEILNDIYPAQENYGTSLASTALNRFLRHWQPPPSDGRLEVFLIAFQIETTVFKFLTIRFPCPAERPTIPENLSTFQNCITLVPSVSGSLVSYQTVEVGVRGHLPHSPSYASRVARYQCWIYAPHFDKETRNGSRPCSRKFREIEN